LKRALITSFETESTIFRSAIAKHYVKGMTAVRLDNEFYIAPSKVSVKDDSSVAVVNAGDEWKMKLYGETNLEQYHAVLKLAFSAP
jgi:hypothetical protein